MTDTALPDVAFYYPGHLWHSENWIKSLLLFFDGIGLLVPEYKQHEPEAFAPHLALPLREKGLLHYLVADQVVDKDVTARLSDVLMRVIDSGTLDRLDKQGTTFHELSMSRLGFGGDSDLAMRLHDALLKRGLAKKSANGVSIPLHPLVRYLVLVLLSQIVRSKGPSLKIELSPATDQAQVVEALTELLDQSLSGSADIAHAPQIGSVVAFDLQTVSVDLTHVPLDEVLAFRHENGKAHRDYVRSARQFARQISTLPSLERHRAFGDRQKDLNDLASDLRRQGQNAWKRPTTFSLGMAGAFWTLGTGDPIGALLAALTLLLSVDSGQNDAGAFSYIFSAQKGLGE
jgi:hypothetical protein